MVSVPLVCARVNMVRTVIGNSWSSSVYIILLLHEFDVDAYDCQ
jgi:hypothetical protein